MLKNNERQVQKKKKKDNNNNRQNKLHYQIITSDITHLNITSNTKWNANLNSFITLQKPHAYACNSNTRNLFQQHCTII